MPWQVLFPPLQIYGWSVKANQPTCLLLPGHWRRLHSGAAETPLAAPLPAAQAEQTKSHRTQAAISCGKRCRTLWCLQLSKPEARLHGGSTIPASILTAGCGNPHIGTAAARHVACMTMTAGPVAWHETRSTRRRRNSSSGGTQTDQQRALTARSVLLSAAESWLDPKSSSMLSIIGGRGRR